MSGKVWLLLVATSFALPLFATETLLPSGEIVGGFVENGGRALVVLQRGPEVADGATMIHIGKSGAILDTYELPDTRVKRMTRLSGDRLLLWRLRGPLDRDGHGTLAHEVLELRPNGKLRRIWEWNSKDRPGWFDYDFALSRDGKTWGMSTRGLARLGEGPRGYDRLEMVFGGTRSRRAKAERTVALRFDEVEEERRWPIEEREGWLILDSEGPVIALSWRGQKFIYHLSESGSGHGVPLFLEEEERFGVWQWEERTLWSWTEKEWRAYHLPDLGLTGDSQTPYWRVKRDGMISGAPHPKRGFVRRVSGSVDGEVRVEHVWRDPWSLVEERHASTFRTGLERVFVSANGQHAIIFERWLPEDGTGGIRAQRKALALEPGA